MLYNFTDPGTLMANSAYGSVLGLAGDIIGDCTHTW